MPGKMIENGGMAQLRHFHPYGNARSDPTVGIGVVQLPP
jgi:hypothetical protein